MSTEQMLSSYEHKDEIIWEIVTSDIKDPDPSATGKARDVDAKAWKKGNNFTILTMKRNCEKEVVDIIGLARTVNEAYEELKAKFEGKIVTTLQ